VHCKQQAINLCIASGYLNLETFYISLQFSASSKVDWQIVTLELRDVVALFNRDSRSLSSSGVDIDSSISTDLTAAFWKASDIVVGWIPGSVS
jgi:hypothetical protein